MLHARCSCPGSRRPRSRLRVPTGCSSCSRSTSKHLIAAGKDELLSTYLTENGIGFGISCTRKITTAEEIRGMLYSDTETKVGDLQECIRDVWRICKDESTLTLNSGAILNMARRSIEFTITAGGWPV